MRTLYVEDCPACGCALVRSDPADLRLSLPAGRHCRLAGCGCHAGATAAPEQPVHTG